MCWNDNFKGISILPDDYNGSKNAVLHLLDHGYKNIAIILAPDFWMKGYRDRLNGWRDAHSDLNLEIDQKLIFKSEKSEIGNESRVGYYATKQIFRCYFLHKRFNCYGNVPSFKGRKIRNS